MTAETPQRPGVNLDAAPPGPRGMVHRAPDPAPAMPPHLMALQYTQQIVQAARALGSVLPVLAEPMANLVAAVEQLVPRAMAGSMEGGAPAPAPPGVAPMMSPPPGPM